MCQRRLIPSPTSKTGWRPILSKQWQSAHAACPIQNKAQSRKSTRSPALPPSPLARDGSTYGCAMQKNRLIGLNRLRPTYSKTAKTIAATTNPSFLLSQKIRRQQTRQRSSRNIPCAVHGQIGYARHNQADKPRA